MKFYVCREKVPSGELLFGDYCFYTKIDKIESEDDGKLTTFFGETFRIPDMLGTELMKKAGIKLRHGEGAIEVDITITRI